MTDNTHPLSKGSRLMHESAKKHGVLPKNSGANLPPLPSSEYEETDIS